MRTIPLLSELRPRVAATQAMVRSVWDRHHAAAWTGGLVALVLATSWAVASVSFWLVPPYLLVMSFVLFAPGESVHDVQDPSILVGPHASIEPNEDRPEDSSDDLENDELGTAGTAVPPIGSGKTRRAKGRGKRGAKTQPEPSTDATWIQVGPGKFVRVEAGGMPPDPTPAVDDASELTSDPGEDPSGPEVEDLVESTTTEPAIDDELTEEFASAELQTADEPVVEPESWTQEHEETFAGYAEAETTETDDEDRAENHGNAPEAFDEAEDHGIAPEAFAGLSMMSEEADSDEVDEANPLEESEVPDEETDNAFSDQVTISGDESTASDDGSHAGTISYWVSTGVFPPRRNIRTGRTNQVPAGYRCRSKRGSGRKRRVRRRTQIRSPPRIYRSL